MQPASIYLIDGYKHPGLALLAAAVLLLLSIVLAFVIKWYNKKYPTDSSTNNDWRVNYDFSGKKAKVTYGQPKINTKGCGHKGCKCVTPCQSCKCHPQDK